MTEEVSLSKSVKNYLINNIKANDKILISISCGLDSTVLYDAIIRSKYFNKKNIYCMIFDHQIRSEGKYEIKQFIKNIAFKENIVTNDEQINEIIEDINFSSTLFFSYLMLNIPLG